MVDVSVTSGAAWVCPARHLADILLPVDLSGVVDGREEESSWSASVLPADDPVLLEQVEEAAPCILTVHCGATSAVSRLLLVSEARTMEVYSHTGEYCGTVRGERDSGIQAHGAGRGPFYRKQLVLHEPSSSCDVKLLSLAGRSSVLVSRLVVGVQPLTPCTPAAAAAAIDMQQVQTLMEEMGSSLSPGAQNLMDMVQLQQKRQTGSLGGLLPLLVGGALPALTLRRSEPPPPAGQQPPHGSPHEAPPAQNGSAPSAEHTPDGTNTMSSRRLLSHTRLAEMMSQLLQGPEQVQASAPAADLLPLLQDVCGQVTQLRTEDAAAEKKTLTNGDVDSAMERRLEEMEQRLKEHVDRRLDALEQKLEKAFFSVLPPLALNRSAVGSAPPAGDDRPPAGSAASDVNGAVCPLRTDR